MKCKFKKISINDRKFSFAVLVFICTILFATNILNRIDFALYDASQKIYDIQPSEDLIIIAIDENSLNELGRWPWPRKIHAELIAKLNTIGVKAIGLDVLFIEPDNFDRHSDGLLINEIRKAKNVVLPVVIERSHADGQFVESLPFPALAAEANLGRVHVEIDEDSVARSIVLREGLGTAYWPHFSSMLMDVVNKNIEPLSTNKLNEINNGFELIKKDQRYINFRSGHQFKSYSYAQVLGQDFDVSIFKDKIVFIGATASGMADSVPTPISGLRQPMPGIEFLAHAFRSIATNSLIIKTPFWFNLFINIVIGILPLFLLPRLNNKNGIILCLAFGLLILKLNLLLPVYFNVWVPLATGIVGVMCSYPVWAWFKIQSATKYLDIQLVRLQNELAQMGASTLLINENNKIKDAFEWRIEQVSKANQKIKELEKLQKETVAFITHDIRVPILSAAEKIKSNLGIDNSVHHQLMRVLEWTEDFLHTSKAQMIEPRDFNELDLVGLFNEVLDDIYPVTLEKSITIRHDLMDFPVWIHGDFNIIYRVLNNLLSNAIKYSHKNSEITISLRKDIDRITIKITNQGEIIDQNHMKKLFKLFGQLDQNSGDRTTGVGLGLYFIKIAIQKHSGTIDVESEQGKTTFIVNLPIVQ